MKAYVLFEVSEGRAQEVLRGIRRLPEVKEADVIAGPFDVIAVVEVEGLDRLGTLIKHEFQSIGGVKSTMTCLSTSRF